MDLAVFAVLVVGVAVLGLGLGLALAPRLTAWDERRAHARDDSHVAGDHGYDSDRPDNRPDDGDGRGAGERDDEGGDADG